MGIESVSVVFLHSSDPSPSFGFSRQHSVAENGLPQMLRANGFTLPSLSFFSHLCDDPVEYDVRRKTRANVEHHISKQQTDIHDDICRRPCVVITANYVHQMERLAFTNPAASIDVVKSYETR